MDALASTRPIEFPVESPDDASGMFDTLTYTKGGAVLRMIEQWLGPEVFRDGIRRYLAAHAYANTETHDLWDALEDASGKPVRRIMDAWIFQKGYPAIEIALDGDAIRLTQRRFAPSLPDDETTWPVPLIVRQVSPDGERVEHVLVEAEGLTVPLAHPDGARGGERRELGVRAHVLRRRAAEPAHRPRPRGPHARGTSEPPGRRVGGRRRGPRDRVVVPGRRGRVRRRDGAVGLADDHHRASPGATGSSTARRASGSATTCAHSCAPPSIASGGIRETEDGELDRELRGDLIRTLGVLGDDPETQAMAREAEALSRTAGGVDASVAAAAVEVVAFAGGEEAFEAFRARMQEAPTPQEQDRYRYALARFRDPALMERLLALAVSEEIPPQDAPVPARACRGEPGPRGDARGATSATIGTSCCRASPPPT